MSSRASNSLGTPKDLSRFIRSKNGKTAEEIAAEDGVTLEVVKKSCLNVELRQGLHTQEYLQQHLIGLVIKLAPRAQIALLEALTAENTREVKNDRGETMLIKEPDHDTRLKAVSEFQKVALAAQPKPGHSTNVKVGVGVGMVGGGQVSGTFVGMEERMREIRQARKGQPVLEAATVRSVQIIDAEVPDEDDSEDEE